MHVESVIISQGAPQPDGRFWVKERHTASNGIVVDREYLNDGTLAVNLVLETRGELILAELEAREAARVAVMGTEVPHTKHDFLDRFSSLERQAIRERAKTDANILDFMEMLAASGGVYKSKAWPGLAYLAHIGVITWARAEFIRDSM